MVEDKNNNNTKIKIQQGLTVASINARDLTAHEHKRLDLIKWMEKHNIDIMCGL